MKTRLNQTLTTAYVSEFFEDLRKMLKPESENLLAELGLAGAGPWPLLLPAHQMKAFGKPLSALRHQGSKNDHPWS